VGKVVEIDPPRARRKKIVRPLSRLRLYRLKQRPIDFSRSANSGKVAVTILASVFPGLGHLLAGRRLFGYTVMATVIVGFTVGALFVRGFGQILIGITAGIHAFSISNLLVTYPQKKEHGASGSLLTIALAALLLVYFYFPVTEDLNRSLMSKGPLVVSRRGQFSLTYFNMLILGLLGVITLGLAIYLKVGSIELLIWAKKMLERIRKVPVKR
jgi:hypothetical protein